MNRRDFITNSSLAGLGIITLITDSCNLSCNNSKQEPSGKDLSNKFELEEMTIDELQEKIKNGKYSYEQIAKIYLKRIDEIDKHGPSVNAVIELNPDALNIARAMDEERKSGNMRGPLHGIPVLVKDNINSGDKMMTTAGSLALEGNKATKDAFIVHKLREAGAVIIGKTNLSEWANFRSTRSVSGWSSRGGQTKNPYILDRSPCGSSSGSAVAVAMNLCMVSIGTETDGSIACPASMNSVVGIKPTVGLVSRSGIIPISKTQDTAGPFARTVRDAAILLGAITGQDPDDPVINQGNRKFEKDYTRFLVSDGLNGKKIGIEKTFLKKHEKIDPLIRQALNQMKSKGATIVDVEFMDKFFKIENKELKILEYEFKDGLNKYLSSSNARVKSLQDVINFNNQNEGRVMPYFKQELFDSAQAKGGLDTKEYIEYLHAILDTTRNLIDAVMNENNLNALCGPPTGPSWCIDFINGDYWTGYGTHSIAAVAGYPSITVPMGNINELPLGITFISKPYDESGLISIAYAYEQASKKRIIPKFKKTLYDSSLSSE